METIRIDRTGRRPIEFDGELVTSSEGKAFDKDALRWHDLRIYRTNGGSCVLEIAYCTKWRGETGHTWAGQVGSLSEAAGVLAQTDPTEHVQGFPPMPEYEDRQRNLTEHIRRRFKTQVSHILGDIVNDVAERID